jgi:acetolactate synthase-1/2/3 large subunit
MKIENKCLKTGAYILLDCLVQNGVEYIFGYPGGAILPIYDELYHWEKLDYIKHILTRHEQSAAHAADAYSRVTNKIGVCFATSGPGATNLVTGIANAKMDSIPMIIITGQVATEFIGTDAFQETDIFSITLPIVKHSYTIRDIKKLPEIIFEAFYLAQNGRPGPVLIDIPKDIGLKEYSEYSYPKFTQLSKKKINFTNEIFKNYINLYDKSCRPLFYIGGGAIRSNSFKILNQYTKLFQIPLTTTLMGKSILNEKDHLSLGMLGMHGTGYANFSTSECDLLIAIGARFDDRVTGKLNEFAAKAKVIHIDIDSSEISKNRKSQLGILGDSKKILKLILNYFKINFKIFKEFQTEKWKNTIYNWKKIYPIIKLKQKTFTPNYLIHRIGIKCPGAVYTTDVGQHQMWCAQLLNVKPKALVTSGGLGTMGFGLPAAIGAKVALPKKEIICISGDASIQMNIQELGTILQYNLNIKIIIINNGWQGMVRQWQESFYGNRFSNSYMKNGAPKFTRLAEAYSLKSYLINNFKKFNSVLKGLLTLQRTLFLNIEIATDCNCYPMVLPGKNNSQMIGLNKI